MYSPENEQKDRGLLRDLTAYWLLGLCNNYGYAVMLSAAHDIIAQFESTPAAENDQITRNVSMVGIDYHPPHRSCHKLSTGAILLADILPSLVVKFFVPFIPFWINIRITTAIGVSAAGFILVGFANAAWIAFLGVILTSASSGLGESTFLAYSTRFNKNVVSTWSSGTGGAGVVGAMSYAILTSLGVTPRRTMLIMLAVPTLEALSFWGILRSPDANDKRLAIKLDDQADDEKLLETLKEKVLYVLKLLKYIMPLLLVYLFEYFINQGLYELVYFENSFMTRPAQYRWFFVDYQIGVFISRSSVNIYHFKHLSLMAVFQFVNVVYFLFEAIYFFTPNIWIVFVIIFWEGLLGGGAYVNTFYRMSTEVPPTNRIFALGIVAQSDSFGISLAGAMAIPVHNAICELRSIHRS